MDNSYTGNSQRDLFSVIERIASDAVLGELLRYCPLDILRCWQIKHYPPQIVILRQGEVCDDFSLIIKGEVDVFTSAEDGRKYTQAHYKKGDILGELEIFQPRPYICSVKSLTEVTLFTLKREDFFRWLALDSYFNQRILQYISDQYYQLSKKAGEDILYSLHQRICFMLSQKYQETDGDIQINKQQLSEQFAAAPRSINRILSTLREENIIATDGETIQIIDPRRLWQYGRH